MFSFLFVCFVVGLNKIVFVHPNHKFNKQVQETQKQYAYLSVTYCFVVVLSLLGRRLLLFLLVFLGVCFIYLLFLVLFVVVVACLF